MPRRGGQRILKSGLNPVFNKIQTAPAALSLYFDFSLTFIYPCTHFSKAAFALSTLLP